VVSAQETVLELFYGRWRSQTLYAGVKLGVFEVVESEPSPSERVARELDLNAALTYRLLRALASLGLLREHGTRVFSVTDAGAMLRSEHPQSMRDAILLREGPEHTAIWKHLPEIVRDGKQSGFVREYGMSAFEYAAGASSYRKAFDAGMSSQSNLQTAWTIEALRDCDLTSISHLCDVGGGQGHLLRHLLVRYPHLVGTVLDMPIVFDPPQALWAEKLDVGGRCKYVAGDMFVDAPAADAYAMKLILHDWNDDDCVKILRNLRRRAAGKGRIFIIEHVIPDAGEPDFAAMFDMHAVPASMRRRPPRETRTTGVGTSGSRNHTKTSVTSVSTRRWGCFDVKAVFLAGVAGVPEGLALNPIAAGEVGPVGAMTVRFHIGGILSNFGRAESM